MAEQRTVPHAAKAAPLRALRADVVRGPDTGKKYRAGSDVLTVGTAPNNDLVLSDETVSRFHLELRRTGAHIQVQDLGSTNGTSIGTALIQTAKVLPGTTLTLGKTQLELTDGEDIEPDLHDDDRLAGIRGRSEPMRALMSKVSRAAKSDVSVLAIGETGTGKELIARALHELSPRAEQHFEIVDCGALMPTLIASELFGHEKGAFTGADRQYIGAFERANGGTLFLDEIGELPSSVQASLLGALERRTIRKLGSDRPVSVDVRVVCATHRDLRAAVNTGAFRQDLYYRIAVLTLRIPPLRERSEDIPLLIEHFLRDLGHDGHLYDLISENALEMLRAHHWPGNVRELRNFVEVALALGETPPLEPSTQQESDTEEPGDQIFAAAAVRKLSTLPFSDARKNINHAFETFYLRELIRAAKGNVSRAARQAKMDRTHLITMLKRHGIE